MLQKSSEVTLYEQSKNQEEIDGEKNFWYKVKVDEETYGWVYGAYVRIFFEDQSLGYSDVTVNSHVFSKNKSFN